MKKTRNIPVLHEVLQNKHSYEVHLQKLQKIQAQRKISLSTKSVNDKAVMIEHIKNQRHHNFMNKLAKEEIRINSENSRLALKLTRTSYMINNKNESERMSRSFLSLSSAKRSREKSITQQNSRMFQKLTTSTPFIDNKKNFSDYQKSRKIAQRLRKYDNDCELKASKVAKSNQRKTLLTPISSKQKINLANFYNKDDIIKNKIEFRKIVTSNIGTLESRRRKLRENSYNNFFNTQVRNPEGI